MYRCFLKRLFDLGITLIALFLLSPLFFILIVTLCLDNNRTVFYIQSRPGKDSKIFKIIKFKTMTDECDINGNLLPDADRLTKIGKFVRSASLDELPQLINVLKGDMSLIGPRPLLIQYLPLYNETQSRRHKVRPGITGWAQVNGRNAISWKQKLELDVWYVDNVSFKIDLKIFCQTIKKVIRRDGINSEINVTMEAFNGNN
jgi:undecaprenyl phosphate N,N'-diacetylbacillosamine 1-phosphate transferase